MRFELQIRKFRIAIWGYTFDSRVHNVCIGFNTQGTTTSRGYLCGHTILHYKGLGWMPWSRAYWFKKHHLSPLWFVALRIHKLEYRLWHRGDKGKAHYLKLKPREFCRTCALPQA